MMLGILLLLSKSVPTSALVIFPGTILFFTFTLLSIFLVILLNSRFDYVAVCGAGARLGFHRSGTTSGRPLSSQGS